MGGFLPINGFCPEIRYPFASSASVPINSYWQSQSGFVYYCDTCMQTDLWSFQAHSTPNSAFFRWEKCIAGPFIVPYGRTVDDGSSHRSVLTTNFYWHKTFLMKTGVNLPGTNLRLHSVGDKFIVLHRLKRAWFCGRLSVTSTQSCVLGSCLFCTCLCMRPVISRGTIKYNCMPWWTKQTSTNIANKG